MNFVGWNNTPTQGDSILRGRGMSELREECCNRSRSVTKGISANSCN